MRYRPWALACLIEVMVFALQGCFKAPSPPPGVRPQSQVSPCAAPIPPPNYKGEVVLVKPPGYSEYVPVGEIYPLASSPEQVASTIDQALEAASRERGHPARSALVLAGDPLLAAYG